MTKIGSSLWTKMVNLSPTGKIASSLILKDAVGCYLYVTQARSNKKFTPEQRADVANYDLANGLTNIALQLAAVKPIENLMTRTVDSKMMKKLYSDLDARLADTNNKNVMTLLKNKKRLTEVIVALFSVLICQSCMKRVVSPFFSVPAGEKSKQIGLIKPKLYDGESMPAKQVKEYDDTFEKAENLKDKIEDKLDSLEDKFEDKFELQNEDD